MKQHHRTAVEYPVSQYKKENFQSWVTSGRDIKLGKSPLIMGILNVTPDSFYDAGRYHRQEDAVAQAEKIIEEGADVIDIGGESTRPSSTPVSEEEELERVIPVVRLVAKRYDIPISVDTYKAGVAQQALDEGAEIVNDISGLRFDPGMAETISRNCAGLVVMHIKGTPGTMQLDPKYDDLLGEVSGSLKGSIDLAVDSGVPLNNIVVDPGIGFGKSLEDNYELIRSIPHFKKLGRPVLIGPSRKSFLWKLLNSGPEEASEGTISAAVFSYLYGADVLRVHDVGGVRRALKIARQFVEGDAKRCP
jgi:dihydropteroate synthase